MGHDKALLMCNSRPLVQDVAEAASVAGSVALVGDPNRYRHLGYDCLPDLRPDCGPLAGIEAALATNRGELNLILACDMPGLDCSWLSRLLSEALRHDALCVATRDLRGVHPLCAVYRSACLPIVQRALDSGRLKLVDVLRDLDAFTVESTHLIRNVNDARDWAAWQSERETTAADAQ